MCTVEQSCTVVLLFTWLKSLTSCLLCMLYTLLFTPGSNIFTHNAMSPINASGKQDNCVYTRIHVRGKHINVIYLHLEVVIHSFQSHLERKLTFFIYKTCYMYPLTCLVISLLGEEWRQKLRAQWTLTYSFLYCISQQVVHTSRTTLFKEIR